MYFQHSNSLGEDLESVGFTRRRRIARPSHPESMLDQRGRKLVPLPLLSVIFSCKFMSQRAAPRHPAGFFETHFVKKYLLGYIYLCHSAYEHTPTARYRRVFVSALMM